MNIPKENRDPRMFGIYNVRMGARVYADLMDTAPVNLGDFNFQYELKKPEYDFGSAGETLPEEFNHIPLKSKVWEFDMPAEL